MIFQPESIEKILKGSKTQTRRIRKPGERFIDYLPGGKVVFTESRTKWATGKTYAICPGRGKPGVARIRLLDIREEPLQDITDADAIAELGAPVWKGPGNPPYERDLINAFFTLWDRINSRPGQRVEDNPIVFVLTFERVER